MQVKMYFHGIMLTPILVIIALFFWFFGIDLIARIRAAGVRHEKTILRQLQRRPPPYFIVKRKVLEPLLLLHSEYYRSLSGPQKIKFLHRCMVFMNRKRFEGREGLVISDEIKIRISAAAIQLTFGLSDYSLKHFHTIIVYPGIYTSPATGVLHRGETNMRGLIILSWQHFTEGYASTDDRINLGLHELAHALDLSRIVKKADPFFHAYFYKWLAVSDTTFHAVNQEEEHFLRKYSGTDQREFFAVCVEQFFEDPQGFKQHLPHLYRHLCILLKQDPAALGLNPPSGDVWSSNQPPSVQQQQPVYTGPLPVMQALSVFIFPLIVLLFHASAPASQPFPLLLFSAFLLSGLLQFPYRLRQLQLSATHLVIRSPVFPFLTKSYALENLICIQYYQRFAGQTLVLTFLNEGNIETAAYKTGLSREDYNSFKEAMCNKDILMSY